MPIKAKYNGSYKDITDLMNVDESIDYVLAKTSSSYKRVYTATRSIEDAPPTTFKSIKPGANLTDYRLYGQTSRNLFDMKTFAETCNQFYATVNYINNTLTFTATNVDAYVNAAYNKGIMIYAADRPSCIDVLPSTTYTISMSSAPKCYISWVNSSYEAVSTYTPIPTNATSYTFTTPENCTKILIRLGKRVENIGDTFVISNIMLNEGSTPLPYEPYGESVGDLVTTEEHAGEYKVPVTVSDGTDTLTTPIYLPEQIRKVGDEAEYIDYATQKQHRVRKNLLQNNARSRTTAGVTFTVNNDGSVTCNTDENGATSLVNLIICMTPNIPESTNLILSGCPKGGSTLTYALQYSNWVNNAREDTGSGINFTKYDYETYPETMVVIRICKGYVCNNLTFYPMIRKADIEDDTYEPYIEDTDVDVTLPALPTLVGTNVLSVGTEVQPSKIDITGHIKTISGGS